MSLQRGGASGRTGSGTDEAIQTPKYHSPGRIGQHQSQQILQNSGHPQRSPNCHAILLCKYLQKERVGLKNISVKTSCQILGDFYIYIYICIA